METRFFKSLKGFSSLSCIVPAIFMMVLYILFLPIETYAQETPEEWAAKAQQYLNSDPPEYYNAADAYVNAGEAALDLEDYESAEDYFEEALSISLPRDFHSISGEAYDGLGKVESERGNFSKALDYHLEAAAKFLEGEDFMGAGWAYIDAGSVAWEGGDATTALSWLEEAAKTFLKDDIFANAGFAYILCGWMMVEQKEYERAIDYYMEAVNVSIEGENNRNAAVAYDGAGNAAKANMDCTLALEYWEKAKDYYEMIEESYTIPSCGLEIVIDRPEKEETFVQGEAVTIQGKVLYAGNPVVPTDSKIYYELVVPDNHAPRSGRFQSGVTDESGGFLVRSFAGWNLGEYELILQANYTVESDQKKVSASSSVNFNVVIPELSDPAPQISQITEIYNQTIPEGPIRTDMSAQNYLDELYIMKEEKEFKAIFTEDEFGYLHNTWLAETIFDEEAYFTCAGYQDQVRQMLDLIRFHEDEGVSQLLHGLDYAPIYRGIEEFEVWGRNMDIQYHAAVVLYPIGKDWKTDPHSMVFDPWFQQRPVTYPMDQWRTIDTWGLIPWFPGIIPTENMNPEENIWFGYPLSGSVICSSFNFTTSQVVKGLNYKVALHCPVSLLVTDSAGNRMGVLPDGNFVQEFLGNIYCVDRGEDDYHWYVELPDDNYDLTITGESGGTFHLTITGEGVEGEYLYYGAQPIADDAQATIHLGPGVLRPDLILPDGTVIQPEDTTSTGRSDKVSYEGESLINFPNPFHDLTNITYHLSAATFVKIHIYNTTGQLIRTWIHEHQPSGKHHVIWDGKNYEGKTVDSGVYITRIVTSYGSVTHKMILL
jgi:tetratricopeptide (TPR) repeat protein